MVQEVGVPASGLTDAVLVDGGQPSRQGRVGGAPPGVVSAETSEYTHEPGTAGQVAAAYMQRTTRGQWVKLGSGLVLLHTGGREALGMLDMGVSRSHTLSLRHPGTGASFHPPCPTAFPSSPIPARCRPVGHAAGPCREERCRGLPPPDGEADGSAAVSDFCSQRHTVCRALCLVLSNRPSPSLEFLPATWFAATCRDVLNSKVRWPSRARGLIRSSEGNTSGVFREPRTVLDGAGGGDRQVGRDGSSPHTD